MYPASVLVGVFLLAWCHFPCLTRTRIERIVVPSPFMFKKTILNSCLPSPLPNHLLPTIFLVHFYTKRSRLSSGRCQVKVHTTQPVYEREQTGWAVRNRLLLSFKLSGPSSPGTQLRPTRWSRKWLGKQRKEKQEFTASRHLYFLSANRWSCDCDSGKWIEW